MKKLQNKFATLIIFLIFVSSNITAQETITSGRLSITIDNPASGAIITSIKDNGIEVLNTTASSNLFTLLIQNTTNNSEFSISSETGWNSVVVNNAGASATIVFSNPISANLPPTLIATVIINTNDEQSDWDIVVNGLGANFSLLDGVFPRLIVKADGNDNFFYPLYSGRLTPNPGSGIDYYDDSADPWDDSVGLYPRGWGTTMQFMSYYNDNYGIYFGFHDPSASMKYFGVRDINNGVSLECKFPVPDKTIADNSWDLPGVFELDLYNGNWYEAAQIYKSWVSSSSNYWPQDSPQRDARQHSVGDISVWLSTYISESSIALAETYIQTAINFFDTPVGVHAYEWNNVEFDHYYPNFFPERTGLPGLVSSIQDNNDAVIMPYTNGRMWDTGVGGNDADDPAAATYYNNEGSPMATRRSDNSAYTQTFEHNVFAVMCPSQPGWRDVIIDAEDQLTRTDRIGAKAVYIDMVAASSPVQCMDATHGHPLGGGSLWRDGYKTMLSDIHTALPEGVFITAEGGCDFVVDEVDAFMIQGWTTDHQVPGWQAVYTGKVQLFGTKTGGSQYGNQQFYAKLGQGYIYGVQTGRQYIWLAINPNSSPKKSMAANYVKRLARMRYKLRDFMSYGEMKKPIDILGDIPDLTYHVKDWGGHRGFTVASYPAVQSTVWQHGDSVLVSLVNTSVPSSPNVINDSLSVSFSFNGSDYGLSGPLAVTEINETSNGSTFFVSNSFTQNLNIRSITPKAYLIQQASDVGNVYYVSTTGNNNNSGTSEAQAWRTIAYAASAASPVEAGDIVYIKAGDYGSENIVFETSGTSDLSILFEGYQNTPGDNPELNHSFGDELDAAIMPLLDGGDRSLAGVSIDFNSMEHIILKNIQITEYNAGIDGWNASYIYLDNIVATSFGDVNSDYDGVGIKFSDDGEGNGGHHNKLINCFVENAAAEGFSFSGNHNKVSNCKVYCNENTNNAAMDYYIVFEGDDNLVSNCYAERIGVLEHDGHGIGFKGNCENNVVINSTAKNLGGGFYVRHRGSQNNLFENCISYELFGFLVRDGASNNTFRNCEAIDNLSAVLFYDTDEDGGAQFAGRNNKFENCIFRNTTENVIDFFYYDRESLCDNNIFANCVIDGGDYLFNCDRSNQDNKLVNCIVTNVNNYSRTAFHQDTNFPLNVIINNTNFFNNGFAIPAGTDITAFDPLYEDIVNHDYHLQSTSMCINAGTIVDAPNSDKEGGPRKLLKEVDLGVFEYGIHWVGFYGANWRNAANWSNNLVPVVTDSVTIPQAKFYYNIPEVFEDSQIDKMYIYGNGQMKVGNNASLELKE